MAEQSLLALLAEARVADTLPAHLPERIAELAQALTGGPAALYVVDIEGCALVRAAGAAGLPARIAITSALGPELGALALAELQAELDVILPGGAVAPLWVRGRATAVLLGAGDPTGELGELARSVGPHLELASGYTDAIDRVRRERRASASAEVQQDLLAPRMSRIEGAEVAGSLLPAYDVGGDWFDHASNPEGTWLTVADAMGKGMRATAVSALALAGLRGARRAGDSLEECAQALHDVVREIGADEPMFLTAVIAVWHAPSRTLTWICCGHPPPLLVAADGTVEDLEAPVALPLGLAEAEPRSFERARRTLRSGDRVVLYSDGITERRTATGRVGRDGLVAAIAGAHDDSAVATAAAVERAVLAASPDRIADDATQLVLRVD
jgi:serine phosphatase RsbU (regulator of sigma subunit)